MNEPNPFFPGDISAALAAADEESAAAVDSAVHPCGPEENWTETGLIDESSGQPVPNIPYKIYDARTGEMLVSGTLNEQGLSPRHCIPMKNTNLFVIFGTDAVADDAMEQMEERAREHALSTNASPDWRGIPAGLSKSEFELAYLKDAVFHGRYQKPNYSLGEALGTGATYVYDFLFSGFDSTYARNEMFESDRELSWEEYQFATNAKSATAGESASAGASDSFSLGFGAETMAGLEVLFNGRRDYDDIVRERDQLERHTQLSNPGYYMTGQIVAGVATVFIPAGAAAKAASAGSKLKAGVATASGVGFLDGAGHDTGGALERIDGGLEGAATAGVATLLLAGAGVLVSKGASKTRIWARATARQYPLAEGTGIRWGGGIQDQGLPWEDYLQRTYSAEARLPKNFESFDFYDAVTGRAISAKTLDTTTPSRIAKPNQIYGTLKGYVDKMAVEKTRSLSGVRLTPDMIASKRLDLAVPEGTSQTAVTEISRAVDYAQSRGVELLVRTAR